VIAENRSSIVSELQKNNVEVRPLIAGAMHKNPFIKKYITREHNKSFPNCELVDTQGFYIPNHQDISEEDIKFIANIVNE